jgi:simple sugar transport system permease protein
MIRTIKKDSTGAGGWERTAFSLAVALLVTAFLIAMLGYNPLAVYGQMLKGSLGSSYQLKETINKTIPLLVMSLGVCICLKGQFVNIGVEGQFFLGAIGATFVVRKIGTAMGSGILPVMFLLAFVAGGLWCLLPALMKVKLKVNEIVVTLMLNYVALKIVSYLQYVVWKDPKAYGFPKIANYPDVATLPKVFGIHCGWIIAIALVIAVYLLLDRSKFGYELTTVGLNPNTARYASINADKVVMLAAFIGGGLCGLAGLMQASGIERTMNDQMSQGLGFTAIVIAYMARLSPAGSVLVSLFFAIMLQGGAYIQSSLQIPSEISTVLEGIILLTILGSEFFTKYRIAIVGKGEGNA